MATTTVYGDLSDGSITSNDATYATARSGALLSAATNGTTGNAGQLNVNPPYYVYETFLAFDTTSVTGAVTSASLTLYAGSDFSTQDFTINVRSYDWGTTLTTGDWIAGANLTTYTLRCHYATSGGWTAATGYTFVDDALAAGILTGSVTRFVVASNRTESGTAPSAASTEYLQIRLSDFSGTTTDPYLSIDTVTTTYAQSQAKIKAVNLESFAQSQTQIKVLNNEAFAQSQTRIKTLNNTSFAQSQGQIKSSTTYSIYAQSQTRIKAIYQTNGQSQSNIKQTYGSFSQARTLITLLVSQNAQASVIIYLSTTILPVSDNSNTGWVRVVIN